MKVNSVITCSRWCFSRPVWYSFSWGKPSFRVSDRNNMGATKRWQNFYICMTHLSNRRARGMTRGWNTVKWKDKSALLWMLVSIATEADRQQHACNRRRGALNGNCWYFIHLFVLIVFLTDVILLRLTCTQPSCTRFGRTNAHTEKWVCCLFGLVN